MNGQPYAQQVAKQKMAKDNIENPDLPLPPVESQSVVEVTRGERGTWRVLDANANRAAEGLRTIEDVARLIREDVAVAQTVKALRHQLAACLDRLPRQHRLAARATHRDAGTGLSDARELDRSDATQIVTAASERVLQSLRNLEEFSKLVSPSLSESFKQLRYAAYDALAQAEFRLLSGRRWDRQWRLYLLIDCSLPLESFRPLVSQLADSGVDVFQLRDKQADGAQLMQYARATLEALRPTKSVLVINDRVDVALACGAAGVHLGQEDLDVQSARQLAGDRLWIGISTHDIEQARAAERAGADYIGCGPTFPSSTKHFEDFAGPQFVREAVAEISVPVFAIGGIGLQNLEEVTRAGCCRVAVSSAILRAVDPSLAARQLSAALLVAAEQSADVA